MNCELPDVQAGFRKGRKTRDQITNFFWIIKKTKIMASGPITSWQIDGETVTDFFFLGAKTTADGDSSHEI